MKNPSFQFYPGDYLRDPAVRSVSLAARGLWIDLLCMMHQAPRRGYLELQEGLPLTCEQIGRMCGAAAREVRDLLSELRVASVFSEEDGVILSRRMIRDEALLVIRRTGGRLGGNPILVKHKVNQKDKQKVIHAANQTPTPSVFSLQSSEEESPLPPFPNLDSPVETAVNEFRLRHPKPSNEQAVAVFFGEHFMRLGEDPALFAVWLGPIRASFAAWCEHWQANGTAYAMKLEKWLHDSAWLKSPPTGGADVKPKFDPSKLEDK